MPLRRNASKDFSRDFLFDLSKAFTADLFQDFAMQPQEAMKLLPSPDQEVFQELIAVIASRGSNLLAAQGRQMIHLQKLNSLRVRLVFS